MFTESEDLGEPRVDVLPAAMNDHLKFIYNMQELTVKKSKIRNECKRRFNTRKKIMEKLNAK